jgi:molybdate transport system substrate-binding protein
MLVGRLGAVGAERFAAGLSKLGMKALLDPSVKKISIGNPQHAPYGRAAEAALRHYGIYDQVANRLVLGKTFRRPRSLWNRATRRRD